MNTKIYVGTYAKYNAGNLKGEWLNLSDYSDAEELFEAMRALHSDENNPEFMFQDREGDLAHMIDESMSESEFEDLYSFMDEANASHLDFEAIVAYSRHTGYELEECVEKAEEAYVGEYASDEDFAESIADVLGYLNENQSWPHNCINWDRAARELMYDYFEESGYYFFRHI